MCCNSLGRRSQKDRFDAARNVIAPLDWHGFAVTHEVVIDSVARLSFNPYSEPGPEKLGNIRKVIKD